ncbi:uncharacterized protein [Trachinotus anak]|uniref:uncharacterized protein n=1 Tax=Trachinotus anak TaxID=443729 RepID=UPI0039F1E248
MDPVPNSPPEIILSDREDPDRSHSGPLSFSYLSPHHCHPISADRSASQEEINIHELSDRLGQLCPLEPHQASIDEEASLRAPTVAETRIAHSDFLSSLVMGSLPPPIQAQENPLNLNLLPGVCPSLLNLQVFSPAARVQPELTPLLPELIMSPCFRQESCWMNISTVASTPSPRFGFSPCALVPCSPFTPDHSWFLLPEVQPVWCSCPQTAPVHQPCDPGLLSRKAGKPVSEQLNVTPKSAGKEQSKETATSEEKQQKNDTADKDKLQSNNTDSKTTSSTASPGSLLSDDDESLAECAFEEYMMIMDSLCPKIHENMEETENKEDEDGEKEKLETENHTFLEYLDELCSDEDFVRKVESMLDIEFLESLLSSDLEMLDLLALEKQEQEVMMLEQSHQPSATSNSDPVTDGTLLLGSTLNTELLDPLVFSDQEFLDFISLEELKQWVLEVTMQEQSYQLSTTSISSPLTDEASQATSHVEGGAQTPILDPLGTSDRNSNHDGETAPLNTTNTGSKEGPMPTDGTPEYFSPVDALSSLGHNGSLFTDSSFTLSPYSSDILTFDLETTDHDALETLFLAGNDGANVSEDASMSLSNFANTQSVQLSQIQSGPLPGDPPASMSPSTSSVAGSTNDPALCFMADLLTDSPPQSAGPPALRVLAWKALPSSQIKESEEQPSHRNLNPKSSCLKDMSHPPNDDLDSAIPLLSIVADSHPDSCDTQVDGDSSGSVPEEQISQELVSPGISSELRTRERCDNEKKCDISEKKATTSVTQKKTATTAREGMAKMTFERNEENKENVTKLVKLRRSHRLSDQNEKKKAELSSEFKTERAEERKPSEKSIKKTLKFTPEKDGVIYGKQTRRSSAERQLCKREESNFEEWSQGTKITQTVEQFSEMVKNEHQKLTGEIQRLMVDVGEQCEPHDSDFCTKVGVENTFSTATPQEKSEKDERSVKRKQEGIQITCFVRRKTRSMTTEEKVKLTPLSVAGDERKIQQSEMKDSPKREVQDKLEVNVEEYANEQSVSRLVIRSRSRGDEESCETANDTKKDLTACEANEDSANRSPTSPPTSSSSSSQRSTRVQADTPPTKDKMIDPGKKSPEEAPLNERNEHKHPVSSLESPSLKTCEKNPKLSPTLDPESLQPNQQQSKKALSEGRAGGHSKVMEKPNVSKRTVNGTGIQKNKAAEKTHHYSPKPSPDQTADVKDDGERPNGEKMDHPSLSLSPMKRYRQECETSEETQTRVNETDKVGIEPEILKSPMKRARWKSKAEVNSRRAEEQKQTRIEKGDEGSSDKGATFGICIPRTRSKTKAESKMISNPSSLTGQEMFEGEKTAGKTPPRDQSATKTRTSLRRLPRFPFKKQRRLSKLPTKYEDFIFYKPKVKGQKRQLNREKGKAGKGKTQRSGKKRDD